MQLRALVLLGLIPGVAAHAAASEQGPYVLVGVGLSRLDLDDKQERDRAAVAHFEASVPGGAGTLSGSDTSAALGVAMGYRFTPSLALEAAYWNFGEKSAGYTLRDATTVNSQESRFAASGPGIALLAQLPLSASWRAHVRVDAVFLRTTVEEVYGFGAGASMAYPSRQSGLQLGYGVGVEADVAEGFALRLEGRRLDAEFDTLAGVEARDLDSLAVSLLKRF